jgi:hypothetical protein
MGDVPHSFDRGAVPGQLVGQPQLRLWPSRGGAQTGAKDGGREHCDLLVSD